MPIPWPSECSPQYLYAGDRPLVLKEKSYSPPARRSRQPARAVSARVRVGRVVRALSSITGFTDNRRHRRKLPVVLIHRSQRCRDDNRAIIGKTKAKQATVACAVCRVVFKPESMLFAQVLRNDGTWDDKKSKGVVGQVSPARVDVYEAVEEIWVNDTFVLRAHLPICNEFSKEL